MTERVSQVDVLELTVKVTHQDGELVYVKFKSQNSEKGIEDYPATAFHPRNMGYKNLDDFISGIKDTLVMLCWNRDQAEKHAPEIIYTGWVGFETTMKIPTFGAPHESQLPPAEVKSEVIL